MSADRLEQLIEEIDDRLASIRLLVTEARQAPRETADPPMATDTAGAAVLLGVSKNVVRKLLDDGDLPSFRPAGTTRRLIRVSAIEEYMRLADGSASPLPDRRAS